MRTLLTATVLPALVAGSALAQTQPTGASAYATSATIAFANPTSALSPCYCGTSTMCGTIYKLSSAQGGSRALVGLKGVFEGLRCPNGPQPFFMSAATEISIPRFPLTAPITLRFG
jgi:hypothetical protein